MRALENANISLALYAAIIMWCFLATEMEVFMVRANDAEANTSHEKSHVVDTMAANFEAPATSGETKPRPADGETVSANPPCFVYPATENFESFVIEVSAYASFPEGKTKFLTSPYMLLAPTEAFEPGAYSWRWRPGKLSNGATEWSKTRQFTVPDNVPIVPFPDMDALVKQIGTSRPRVQITAAQLAPMRQQAHQQFGEKWLSDVRRRAERARGKELLPEPDLLPGDDPERRRQLYQKTFQTTRPFFREMASLASDFLLTCNELSGQEAKRRLLHIISWDPQGSTSLGHNDEPATEVIRYCPTVFDRVYQLLTEDEKSRCLECLMVRMNEMRDRWRKYPFEKRPYESHNMGYYLPDALEASLALIGEAPVEEILHYTMMQLWSPFYPPYGGADGGWSEGPSYWGWSTAVFARTYKLVEQTTGIAVHLRSNVRNMWRYKMFGNPPYFTMSPFGDGHESRAGGGQTMATLAALYENPYAKWYAEWQNVRLSGMDALLFDSDNIEAKEPSDLPQGQAFYDVGLACMHTSLPDPTNNVAVLMRSCPFGSISHAYADQNTFVLHAYGEPLLIASGYYQLYGHPHHAQWTWETKASNSVLVNGLGQSKRDWNAKGRLKTFHTTAAGDYAVGDASQAYKGKLSRFDRRIVFLRPVHTGGEAVVVIRDDLAAPEPSTYQFLLHALNKMEVDEDKQSVTVAKGQARCRVEFLKPSRLIFEQHNQFTQPPYREAPDQWHLAASTVEKAKSSSSLIAVQPCRTGEVAKLLPTRMEVGENGVSLVMSDADRTIMVVFRTDRNARAVKVGEVATDAQAASVCLVGGEVRSAVMFEGTIFAYGGMILLEGEASSAVSK